MNRRNLFAALAAAVTVAAAAGPAMAQGRGWGPDGMGPPGQRRRGWDSGRPGFGPGWRGGPPPGRGWRRRGPPPGRGWRRRRWD